MAISSADTAFTLYVKPGCPWCVDAVEFLREKGYRFDEVNVLRDPEGFAEMRRLSKQSLTPTLAVGDDLLLADFDLDQLETFIGQHDLQP